MVSIHPKIAISNVVGKMKGKSSYLLRKKYWTSIKKKLWGNHFWSPSYCVVSCGGASLEIVQAYIKKIRGNRLLKNKLSSLKQSQLKINRSLFADPPLKEWDCAHNFVQ
jgi:REP-associated tyrosine transposase